MASSEFIITTRILQGIALLCKLRLFFYENLTGTTKFLKIGKKKRMNSGLSSKNAGMQIVQMAQTNKLQQKIR